MVGDRFLIGTATFEVTQPRVTCYRVGLRLGEPTMASLLVAHHRPGFYLRVLEEGTVESGDDIRLVERPDESLSVADIDALLYLPGKQPEDLRRAVRIEALSEGWRQSFTELLKGLDHAPGAVGWAGFKPLTVTGVESESADVTSLVLSARDGSRLPPARGGQHLTVRVPAGPAGESVIRNYSISDFSPDGGYRISVKRERLGVASSWFQRCAMAADLNVETTVPAGEFTLDAAGDKPLLFVSAGIGITPLLSMLRELAERRAGQRVVWWHVARDASSRVFREESLAMVARLPAGEAHVSYTRDVAAVDPGGSPGPEQVHSGRPVLDDLTALDLPAETLAFLCGPTAFMTSVRRLLADLGLGDDQVLSEVFGQPSSDTQSQQPVALPPGPPGAGPDVTFSRSGLTVPFSDTYRSILELAEACHVPVSWSCRTGVCQTCRRSKLEGTVDYDPTPLDPPSEEMVLLCCSRPSSAVVIDA
jgi:ferredoxin-NADP reductase